MATMLSDVIDLGQLPINVSEILPFLTEADGNFISSEGPTWDFKESWPHSYSDSYFHGLCRLVCAFANTRGGIIVFGVSDKERKGDRNRIQPNLDRFIQGFQQLTGESFEHDFRRFNDPTTGAFEVLLILPLPQQRLPLRFTKNDQYYPSNVIWVRQGHEVIEASSRHIAQLYCRSLAQDEGANVEVDGNIPPSPATIRQFVGRMLTIDKVFEWLKLSDQPRMFLFGKGGSGKSTIAFQIAKVLRESGSGFLIEGQSPLETVIFLSAKERELNTDTLLERPFAHNDFKDERSLYEAIITEGGSENESLDHLSMEQLRQEIVSLFNRSACFIVIDDIDTLTTKGLEAGFEFLIGALYRSKKRSKVLYTLRNAPSHALSNSIDVPGLAPGNEYEAFVALACAQFKVDPPLPDCRDGKLVAISERRPLVVESVIALRRRVDSYDRAIELFSRGGGDDVRRYVFRREWDAIKPASKGRELLALLALLKTKISYDDLIALMYDNAAIVPDALDEVQEMFVQVERTGDRSTYRLNDLTRSFVLEAAQELDRYTGLRSRVQKFVTNIYADSPELNKLLRNVDRLLRGARLHGDTTSTAEAWRMLMAAKSSDAIREDPRYMAICGYVALMLSPPNMAESRDYFQNSFAMRHGPQPEYVREWFIAEQRLDGADYWTNRIFELVQQAKDYDETVRLEFLSRRAVTLYNLAKDGFVSEPEKSEIRLVQAMHLHGKGYQITYSDDTKQASMFERNFTNTTFLLKNLLVRAQRTDDLIDYIIGLSKSRDVKLDPLLEPIRELARWAAHFTKPGNLARAEGRLQFLAKSLGTAECWFDGAIKELCVSYCSDAAAELNSKRKKAPLR